MSEENKAIVRRLWEEVFNQGNLDVVDEIIDSDHVFHHPLLSENRSGPDVVKGVATLFRRISPDIQVTVEDYITEGDKVVSRWTANGTLARRLRSAEVTVDEVVISGIGIFRVSGGQIAETWQRVEDHRDGSMPNEECKEYLLEDQHVSDLITDDERVCCWFRVCC